MTNYFHLTALLLFLFLINGCTQNNAQRNFEDEAYSTPQNFTETNNQGVIKDVDEDDWRTSPLFQGLIKVNPAYPNPVNTSQALQFEVEVTGINSVNGLIVMTRAVNGEFYNLYQFPETLNPGLYNFHINPIEFDYAGQNVEGARGLNRVFMYDGRQRLISFGDVMVQ